MAKTTAVKAFISTKRRTQQMLMALQDDTESGAELKNEDLFQLQHHHMLTCLERTTVSTNHSLHFSNTYMYLTKIMIYFLLYMPIRVTVTLMKKVKVHKFQCGTL